MILDEIKNPSDLKGLTIPELQTLCNEIREVIIQTCSKTGGHLAASLGAIELIVALMYVFLPLKDKIIFDVGHQTYAHKILTGRKDKFHTLRQYQGLSGFPNPDESEYDLFKIGHGGCAISLALGLAKARDIKKTDERIIAVIGDGGLTSGMAFEGLNHAGDIKTDFLVVLNDNEMFISNTVGALSNYLSKLRTTYSYIKAREEFKYILEKIPYLGPKIFKLAKKTKDEIKSFVFPGLLFEELGFNYIGPIDGHNIDILQRTFKFAKTLSGPVLVHTFTKKGKGYTHSENNATLYHGISSFDIESGEIIHKSQVPTYTKVFSKTLIKLAKEDGKIVAITAAMKDGCGLKEFEEMFPDRFFDVGMAEQHAVSFAAGLARQGFKPVVAIYSTFLQRAYDQILHDVCLQNLPVIFAIDRAGIVGEDGETHQGIFDISYLSHIPNLVLLAPKDEEELQDMLFSAFHYNMPVAIRYPRGQGYGVKIGEPKLLDFGKCEILNSGNDILIIGVGNTVYTCCDTAGELKKIRINPTIINARFVKPIDEEMLCNLAKKIDKVITVEENVLGGGFGSQVLEILSRNNITCKTKIIGLPDKFIEHGGQKILREKYGLTKENIVEEVKKLIK